MFAGPGGRLRESLDDDSTVVVVAGAFAGYGTFGPYREEGGEHWKGAEVRSLFVDTSSWGAGVADAMMAAGLEWLAGHGYERVAVWSFVANARANRFYSRWGFEPDGAREPIEAFSGLEGQRLVRAL